MRKSLSLFDALDKIMVLTQDFQKETYFKLIEVEIPAPR